MKKTTWREYFDAEVFREEERCLCAPFFLFLLSYQTSFFMIWLFKMVKNKFNTGEMLVFSNIFLFVFCLWSWGHKKTWREYFDAEWWKSKEMFVCSVFFFFFFILFSFIITNKLKTWSSSLFSSQKRMLTSSQTQKTR